MVEVCNFEISADAQTLITLTAALKAATALIRIKMIYIELANDWTAGNLFALYWEGEDPAADTSVRMFPKTTAGAYGLNLMGKDQRGISGTPSKNLMAYNPNDGTVRGTIHYEIVR